MKETENRRTKRTQRDYNMAFKLAVVTQVEKGEMNYKQAQERYGIQGKSTVLVWLRKHGTLEWKITKTLFNNIITHTCEFVNNWSNYRRYGLSFFIFFLVIWE